MLRDQFMLNEKCFNLVAGMRMMGLRFSTYYLSWFGIYSAGMLIAAALMTAAVKVIGYLPNSNHLLLYVTLALLGFTSLTFTFLLLATLGKGGTNDPEKAKQAGQGGGFFATLLVGVFAILFFTDASYGAWAACFAAVRTPPGRVWGGPGVYRPS